MSLTVPLPSRPPEQVARPPDTRPRGAVRVGPVTFGSALAYLLVWAVVLLAVQLLALVGAHVALSRLGALESLSRALDPLVAGEVEPGGVLPALELGALLPWAALVAAAVTVLGLVVALALVLVHNAVCRLTGGPRVHLG